MKQLTVLQHLAAEGLGTLEPILNAAEISVRSIRVFDGEKVPAELGKDNGLIVLGDPVGNLTVQTAVFSYDLSDITCSCSSLSKTVMKAK